jgi:hypothetical protein
MQDVLDTNWLNHNATYVKNRRHYVLSIFKFPIDLLALSSAPPASAAAEGALLKPGDLEHQEVANSYGCRMCSMEFENVDKMRAHFKSDSHLTRIRRGRMFSDPTSTTGAAAAPAGGGDGGSDGASDSEGGGESSDDSAGGVQAIPPNGDYVRFEEGSVKRTYSSQEGPRTVFRRPLWQPLEFSVSNAVLDASTDAEGLAVNPWAAVGRTLETYCINPMWCVVALRSGRFAGAVFEGNKEVAHKAFRR